MDELPLVLEPWLLPIADALDEEQARREEQALERERRKRSKRGINNGHY